MIKIEWLSGVRPALFLSTLHIYVFLNFCYFNFLQVFHYTKVVGNGILCLKALNSLDGIIPSFVIGSTNVL